MNQEIIKTIGICCFIFLVLVAGFRFFLCTYGAVEMTRNPDADPDNPYILRFVVNPITWLNKKYVILKVRKKNN